MADSLSGFVSTKPSPYLQLLSPFSPGSSTSLTEKPPHGGLVPALPSSPTLTEKPPHGGLVPALPSSPTLSMDSFPGLPYSTSFFMSDHSIFYSIVLRNHPTGPKQTF